MLTTRKVNKLNRSLSVVIPKEVLATTGIKAGDELAFTVNDDKSITLRPVVRERNADAQMVKRYADLYQQLKPAMDYLKEK